MKSTKELARELGFLRKRSKKPASVLCKLKQTSQIFSYLIVLDFESTCWKGVKNKPQEIIEFPAVILNGKTGEIEAEFQYYVQPTENPILSDFCTELTGISQQQVDDGIPLAICLSKFRTWLSQIKNEKKLVFNASPGESSNLCTFVTWSDWDLNVCLHYECRRKQLRKPTEMDSWIDLRLTYRTFYQRRPQGLNGALQDLGIAFEGREHSGLHDSRNTARLAWRMMSDGCVLRNTKSLNVKPNATSVKSVLPVGNENQINQTHICRESSPVTVYTDSVEITGIPSNSNIKKRALQEMSVNCQMNFKTPNTVGKNQTLKQSETKKQCMNPHRSANGPLSSVRSATSTGHKASHVFKTPSTSGVHCSELKKTPPMCRCGRRAKRLLVQNPGPNQGRFFFTCPLGKRDSNGMKKSGCSFFKWESEDLGTTPILRGQTTKIVSIGNSKGPFSANSKVQSFITQPDFNTPQSVLRFSGKKTLGVKRR